MSGKTMTGSAMLVAGGPSEIGEAASPALGSQGASALMVRRNPARIARIKAKINKEVPGSQLPMLQGLTRGADVVSTSLRRVPSEVHP